MLLSFGKRNWIEWELAVAAVNWNCNPMSSRYQKSIFCRKTKLDWKETLASEEWRRRASLDATHQASATPLHQWPRPGRRGAQRTVVAAEWDPSSWPLPSSWFILPWLTALGFTLAQFPACFRAHRHHSSRRGHDADVAALWTRLPRAATLTPALAAARRHALQTISQSFGTALFSPALLLRTHAQETPHLDRITTRCTFFCYIITPHPNAHTYSRFHWRFSYRISHQHT